jgi:hypothetical protein
VIPVDVLTVLAPGEAIRPPVLAALAEQGCVALTHHVVPGPRRPGEWRAAAIARARNAARRCGDAHYALFLDADVVLPPLGVERLVYGLVLNPGYAALGINYQRDTGELVPLHVAMGATLFYRPVLAAIQFRTEPGRCECTCCCVDLRRLGYEIGYLPGLRAEHLKDRSPGPETRRE